LVDEESFNIKKTELFTSIQEIENKISITENKLDKNKENQVKIKTDIEQTTNLAKNYYSKLDTNSKVLLDPNKTYTEKYNQTNNIINSSTSTNTRRAFSRSVAVSSTTNLPSLSEVSE
jgi:hypothetical protein